LTDVKKGRKGLFEVIIRMSGGLLALCPRQAWHWSPDCFGKAGSMNWQNAN